MYNNYRSNMNIFAPQNQQSDVPDGFKISESMLIDELPGSIAQLFINAHDSIEKNKQLLQGYKKNEKERTEKESELIAKISDLKKDCENDLLFGLNSLAHQIDNGKKMLKEFRAELNESKNDLLNVNSNKTFPSPFLLRYSKQLEEVSESISEDIEAYRSHLQSLSKNSCDSNQNLNQIKNDMLFNFYNEEYEALLRSSTKISRLCKKISDTRTLLCQKLKINQLPFIDETEDTQDSVFLSIEAKYRQFQENKKAKLMKGIKESDLFGQPTKLDAPSTGIGSSLFSTNYSSFGAGSSGGSFLSKRNSNNFAVKPPAVNTSTTNGMPTLYKAPDAPKESRNPFGN